MKLETFFKKFELFAEAPNAAARLRQLVSQLAVQGQLVDHRSEDGDARSIFRGADRVGVAVAGDVRYSVPSSWCWVRFAAVGEQRLGKMLDQKGNRGELKPYLRNTNVQWMRFELDDVKELRLEADELEEFRLRPGDLLICEGGEPGRCAIWREPNREMYFQKALHRVRLRKGILADYLAICLQVDSKNGVLERAFTGATIKHLTGRSLSEYSVPMPPLGEQKRIVAKVDELVALCGRLEAQDQAREARRATLAQASLARFAAEPTPANLNFLFHGSYGIEPANLRKSILALAVQGRLVRQDSGEEAAQRAIRRLPTQPRPARFEKRSSARIQGLAALSVGPTQREVPKGWACVPLIEVARLESGHTPSRSRPDWWGGDVPWVGLVDARLHDGRAIIETLQHTNEQGLANSAARMLPAGTVCVSRTASVGYVTILGKPMATSQDFVNWVPSAAVTPDWLRLVFTAEKDAFSRFSKGAVHQTIYYPEWLSMHTLLPPVAEQRRIVDRVDQLMTLVDRLEEQLASSREAAENLTEAVVAELTAQTH